MKRPPSSNLHAITGVRATFPAQAAPMMYSGTWNGWMLAMMLIWPVLIIAAIAAIVALTRQTPSPQTHRRSAKEILDRRLAAGEIDAAEYARTADMLKNGNPA
ncbi:MAG: SHOCT domain-containing protein [Candidatus Nanopelagicales bacterium]